MTRGGPARPEDKRLSRPGRLGRPRDGRFGRSEGDVARIGVTGATGFIGGALVPRLAAAGHQLVLVDNRTGPLQIASDEFPVQSADFASEEALRPLVQCDVVLHLGAVSGVMACAEDPDGSARVNVAGTRALVAACRKSKVPVAFASSFAVVGRPDRLPVTETTPARPTHEYARQKAAGEAIVAALSGADGAASAVLRMSNVYGTYERDGRTVAKGNVISRFLEQARSGRLSVNSPGTQARDFIHLDDVLRHWEAAAGFLLHAAPTDAATFSVASGESMSVLALARLTAELWAEARPGDAPLRVDVVENPRQGIELIDPEFAVDRAETERRLGLRCRHDVRATIRDLVPPTGNRP